MKSYKMLPVTLVLPEDQDLADLAARLGRGNVSPWIKQAIRKQAKAEGMVIPSTGAIVPTEGRDETG